jgi:hypothetical protein
MLKGAAAGLTLLSLNLHDALKCCLEVVAFDQSYVSLNNPAVSQKAFATVANVLGAFIRQICEFLAMANVASG